MNRMLRWMFAFCFMVILPVCALAEIWTEDQFTSDGQFRIRYYLFQDEWPTQLAEPMQEYGYDVTDLLSGAGLEDADCFSALMLVEIQGTTQLIGAAQVNDQAWQVIRFGSHLLRKTADLGMGIVESPGGTVPGLAVSYWNQEKPEFDLFQFSPNRVWEMVGYRTDDLMISTAGKNVVVIDTAGQERIYGASPSFWMERMTSIDEYPITEEACIRFSQTVVDHSLRNP